MPIASTDGPPVFPPNVRLLGLDVGTKTVGLAVSDPLGMVATPLTTLRRKKWAQDAVAVHDLVAEREIGGVVAGLPLNMDGSEGPRCQGVRQFCKNLTEKIDLPLLLWDERWSTAAVERQLIDADVSRKKRADVIDSHAAAWILQGYLDAQARRQQTE